MTGKVQPYATFACAALLLAAPASACYCRPRSPSEQSYARKFEEVVHLEPLCPDLLTGLIREADDDLRLSAHPSVTIEGPAGMPRLPVLTGGLEGAFMSDIDTALQSCKARIAAGKSAGAPLAH